MSWLKEQAYVAARDTSPDLRHDELSHTEVVSAAMEKLARTFAAKVLRETLQSEYSSGRAVVHACFPSGYQVSDCFGDCGTYETLEKADERIEHLIQCAIEEGDKI